MPQNVHTGVGQGAVRPSGRSVLLKSFVDYAYVTTTYKGTDNLGISDHATAKANIGGNYTDSILISDNAYASNSPIVHTEVFTESIFGAQTNATHTDSLTFNDNFIRTQGNTDSIPLSDSFNSKPPTTDTLTISDNATHP